MMPNGNTKVSNALCTERRTSCDMLLTEKFDRLREDKKQEWDAVKNTIKTSFTAATAIIAIIEVGLRLAGF